MADDRRDPETRPSPDALLDEAVRETRGRLKIFLGAAPGVGKTWEMLTAGQALRGFTFGAAYAAHDEAEVGRLAPGLRADFVILDRDPLAIPAAELDSLKVQATWVDGEPVYSAD